jgi:DNA modification methylase
MTRQGRKALQNHPTPKPVPLVMDIIKDSTQIGERVLDPFLGSGTTLLAAEKTRRYCMGIEIDPLYVDLSIRRWQELTKKDAIHVGSGLTFAAKEQGLKAPKRIRERKHGS